MESWEWLDRQAIAIDTQILKLQHRRDELLRQDKEYAGYLNEFANRGAGCPMSIRRFHKLSNELRDLNQEFLSDESESVWERVYPRMLTLEQLLLA